MKKIISLFLLSLLFIIPLSAQQEDSEGRKKTKATQVDSTGNVMFQCQVVPMVGTNGIQSPEIGTKYSINVFAGINKSVSILEFGTIANIVKEDLRGVQFGGVFNYVGGPSNAAQFAGAANVNLKKVTGAQFSGAANFSKDTVWGAQLTGGINMALKEMKGFQGGIVNYAGEMKGFQLGLVNVTRKFPNGFSLGLINVHDSVGKNTACLGLLSFVRSGLHEVDFSANDVTHFNIAFKTGTYRLYNIITAGVHFDEAIPFWGYGYGLGTQMNMSESFFSNIELTAHSFHTFESWTDNMNFLARLSASFGVNLGEIASLYGGPTFNVHFNRIEDQDTIVLKEITAISPLFSKSYDDFDLKMWIGFQGGIRF